MVTIYDLLEVSENASKEEIEKSYTRLIMEYQMNPSLDAEANKDNEMILNKLKIAYGILSNDEKRKKYDEDLAKKRAEELIKNVSVAPQVNEESQKVEESVQEKTVEPVQSVPAQPTAQTNEIVETNESYKIVEEEEEVVLTKEEQARLRKAAQKEFKTNLKKAQKAEEEYNQAYNEAYNNYLRKLGYEVKEPWTWKRVKNTIIGILIIVIVCTLVWIIPPTRQILIDFYNENYIVKALVDIVIALVNAILGIFK